MAKKIHIDEEDRILDGTNAMMKNRDKHCRNCKHLFGDPDIGPGKCKAFPKGIPFDIWTGQTIHNRKMYHQTNTLSFKRK